MDGFVIRSLSLSSLVLLAVQNFTFGVLLPLCRRPDRDGHQFYAPTSVAMMEVIKMLIAIFAICLERTMRPTADANVQNESRYSLLAQSPDSSVTLVDEGDDEACIDVKDMRALLPTEVSQNAGYEAIFTLQAFRMSIPALLYVLQNNLQVLSAGYLSAVQFQVLSQFKLVSTALFSVWLLGRTLSSRQWAALLLLFVGTAMVQVSSAVQRQGVVLTEPVSSSLYIGVAAILGACTCSGLAGTLIEMQLKRKTGFWITNLHLSSFSILPALVPIFSDALARNKFEPFRYFNTLTWSMILVNVMGGLLVAIVLKFADNIQKGFAICASLIATVFYNGWISGQSISALQLLGASCVAASTMWYANAHPVRSEKRV